ncbi:amino acid ABC transporter permease [Pectinatus brassicae]|uniref:Polar amino acid transport system permease protein/polar amino acid transport system substrate-binding protein n=1 Tax=Pectinatus brassicae TaxID=862415 RepID=A0A840UW39_9FIRM|nr:amino acid ABC transporter permease [Pectinatus brassicae]MBB5336645.1 polar amino acid transport system permease protein/polar amino acid transport system substrate-binding protein [Pectinatus brassicae]
MDFGVVMRYIPMFFTGIKLTIFISIAAIFIAVIVGLLIYFMKASSIKIGGFHFLRVIAFAFIEIMRGTPLLLQVLIAYVLVGMLPMSSELPSNFAAIIASIAAIGLNSSVYIAEIFRAGIQSIPKGQMEAARSLGLTHLMAMRKVIMPQAIKNILPAIGNEFVADIKGSSMAYVLGIAELTFTAKVVQGATYRGLEPLIVSAVFYLILTFSLGRFVGWTERRMQQDDRY